MGEVLATLKVMPESPEVDLEELKTNITNVIPKEAKLHAIEEEPIAFGLVALNVKFIVDDSEGGTEPTEEAIRNLDNINSAEITDVGLI
ncbi:MAG: elongation factor 1-beta [Methanobrevibacter boviskoreani]|jgi:elongation factor 1-beta|uniref:elongation factor 1-beta n=1 Tax=Methanobrevibacter TaxID=2172 RepID=UPI00033485FD|nr:MULTISPECIES: elongation factor 1-beta [Methanobrevibacter]AGN17333.1 translation elongation factor aEF-1 beta [Methanobrevibacter sp. AbM4]MCI6775641.1 elongation factor 1-beta [Methanobrevibacter boviskoreani]MCI6931281.1 elongation factor 1-beta [Methanobrevibacter boviskoreani]MDD6256123.1 elongation factor 1-beta [Methanobrevibacter boviskoreani]MDY5615104.1 elongation factor 1-beta [Methanobrevibacter boviskoreani]